MQSGIDDLERADVSVLTFVGVPSINNNTIEADFIIVTWLSLTQINIVNLSAFI